jgi:hypothetical protein
MCVHTSTSAGAARELTEAVARKLDKQGPGVALSRARVQTRDGETLFYRGKEAPDPSRRRLHDASFGASVMFKSSYTACRNLNVDYHPVQLDSTVHPFQVQPGVCAGESQRGATER